MLARLNALDLPNKALGYDLIKNPPVFFFLMYFFVSEFAYLPSARTVGHERVPEVKYSVASEFP